ncbi:hypothetical protein C8J57DRAFT_1591791 [Mycena rebaudengoi]|nr:hypothetical protein C8J57DRAFT_1591791 [Mycena rebaudengoi]
MSVATRPPPTKSTRMHALDDRAVETLCNAGMLRSLTPSNSQPPAPDNRAELPLHSSTSIFSARKYTCSPRMQRVLLSRVTATFMRLNASLAALKELQSEAAAVLPKSEPHKRSPASRKFRCRVVQSLLDSYPPRPLMRFITADNAPLASPNVFTFVDRLLRFDSRERFTVVEAIAYPYLSTVRVEGGGAKAETMSDLGVFWLPAQMLTDPIPHLPHPTAEMDASSFPLILLSATILTPERSILCLHSHLSISTSKAPPFFSKTTPNVKPNFLLAALASEVLAARKSPLIGMSRSVGTGYRWIFRR